ncbi:hypothetical protein [Polyangium aurulentum]|uniref:hypothetical protein n=1 Tax=Polyangium aurulentum TaxID=2567896 RepID=UPI0010AE81F5|nr:hypothetical protein [Polyangium aurulentum]UQA57060.1 hypothetical protein E8A73_038085 [Polyangium aurulentum]
MDEIVYEERSGPPTTNVLHVKIRRSSRGGFVVDVWLEDEEGNTLGAAHLDYPAICCFEVLFLAAVEGAVMIEAAAQEGKGVMPCPACPACPEAPEAPPRPLATAPRRRGVPSRAPAARPSLFMKGGALIGLGIAPDPAVGLQAGLGVRIWPWFSVEADMVGTASLPVAGASSTLSGAWTVSGSLAPCFWIDTRYGVCGVVRGGSLWPTTARSRLEAVAAPHGIGAVDLRGLAELPLPWPNWALRAEGEFGWTFVRPQLDDPRGPIPLGRPWTAHLGLLVVKAFRGSGR